MTLGQTIGGTNQFHVFLTITITRLATVAFAAMPCEEEHSIKTNPKQGLLCDQF
jgi:hypothetical protein